MPIHPLNSYPLYPKYVHMAPSRCRWQPRTSANSSDTFLKQSPIRFCVWFFIFNDLACIDSIAFATMGTFLATLLIGFWASLRQSCVIVRAIMATSLSHVINAGSQPLIIVSDWLVTFNHSIVFVLLSRTTDVINSVYFDDISTVDIEWQLNLSNPSFDNTM